MTCTVHDTHHNVVNGICLSYGDSAPALVAARPSGAIRAVVMPRQANERRDLVHLHQPLSAALELNSLGTVGDDSLRYPAYRSTT